MAWQTINYTCGCSDRQQMYGSMADRARRVERLEQTGCPACRAKGSSLTGSTKQISWAEDIRAAQAKIVNAAIARVETHENKLATEEIRIAMIAWLKESLTETSASAWIDRRNDTERSLLVKASRAALAV